MHNRLVLFTLVVQLLLQGCAALPSSGPAAEDIPENATNEAADFVVIPMTAQNAAILGQPQIRSIEDKFGTNSARPARPNIGIGDTLAVSIWEASSDGLFSTAETKQTQLTITVDQSRSIFIPYAGRISVAGFGVEDLRDEITEKLQGQAIDPQVQVALVARESQKLTVVGDVTAPGQFDVPPNGIRLIEAIARAGGAQAPSFETELIVTRGNTRATARMDTVLANTRNNIWLRPEDTIQVRHRPRSFTAFGAVSAQNLQPFRTENVTLAEALAQAGGLDDNQADADGVFLFRYETAQRLSQAGIAAPEQTDPREIPTIYRLDLSEPEAFFIAGAFAMHDKDIIYVANAPATDLQKFTATILSPLLSSTNTIDGLVN
ncbi:polysaccharide biosynthesis/export family protein [Yoonia sp. BS5-3]|uniref:Polysaccharide biosynthesis/export family protein n=1 Tax=Yoonia phaeophyticola TaxID=3137369 RepID=A0ABZ2V6T0_9RHOB